MNGEVKTNFRTIPRKYFDIYGRQADPRAAVGFAGHTGRQHDVPTAPVSALWCCGITGRLSQLTFATACSPSEQPSVLALKARDFMLSRTMRDTHRPFVRFNACRVPEAVAKTDEPFLVVSATAGD